MVAPGGLARLGQRELDANASMSAPSPSETRRPSNGEQRDEGPLARRGQSGGDEESADLVTVQPRGVRLVVEARPANVGRW